MRWSQLAAEIARAIKARRLTQQGAAGPLGVGQSEVSRIIRGQFRGVSEAKLLDRVTWLGHDVTIVVGPVRRRAGRIELHNFFISTTLLDVSGNRRSSAGRTLVAVGERHWTTGPPKR